jgi:hypothetical protein
VRSVVSGRAGVDEKKMFGGLAFLLDLHMFCGVIGADLVVRIGADATRAALESPHTRPMDFTGSALAGYVYVAPAGVESEAALRSWVEQAAAFAASLPPK